MYISRQFLCVFIIIMTLMFTSCTSTLSAIQEIESRKEQLASLEAEAREKISQKQNGDIDTSRSSKEENIKLLTETANYIYDNFKAEMEDLAHDLSAYEPKKNNDIPKKLEKELDLKVTDFNMFIEETVYKEKGLEIGFGSITLTQPLSVDFSVKLKRPYSGYIAIVYTTEQDKLNEAIINQILSDNWCILEPVFDDF